MMTKKTSTAVPVTASDRREMIATSLQQVLGELARLRAQRQAGELGELPEGWGEIRMLADEVADQADGLEHVRPPADKPGPIVAAPVDPPAPAAPAPAAAPTEIRAELAELRDQVQQVQKDVEQAALQVVQHAQQELVQVRAELEIVKSKREEALELAAKAAERATVAEAELERVHQAGLGAAQVLLQERAAPPAPPEAAPAPAAPARPEPRVVRDTEPEVSPPPPRTRSRGRHTMTPEHARAD